MTAPFTTSQMHGTFAYGDASGQLTATFDLRSGRVDAAGTGFWSAETARLYFADWAEMVAAMHDRGTALRVIADLSTARTQSTDVAALLGMCANMHRGRDRVALVVPSALMTMQMRRVVAAPCHALFTCVEEAARWLAAEAGAQARCA